MVKYNQEDLRSHYGVGAIIKNENDEILMLKHNKFNLWTIPIGKVDFGEDIFEGRNRELQEELNIKAKEMKDLISGDYYYKRDGYRVKVEIHIFDVLSYTGKLKNNEPHKHSDMRWMSLNDIQKLKQQSDATALYLSYINKSPRRNMIKNSLKNVLSQINTLLESIGSSEFKTRFNNENVSIRLTGIEKEESLDILKRFEKYLKSKESTILKKVSDLYGEWHDGDKVTLQELKKMLVIETITIDKHNKGTTIKVWRKTRDSFFGGHSVNTTIKYDGDKVVLESLVDIEG